MCAGVEICLPQAYSAAHRIRGDELGCVVRGGEASLDEKAGHGCCRCWPIRPNILGKTVRPGLLLSRQRHTSCTHNEADGLERYIISIHKLLIRHLCNSSSTCKRSVNEQLSPKTIIRHMISLSQLSRHKEICSSKIGKK